jgi:hypothetical protein
MNGAAAVGMCVLCGAHNQQQQQLQQQEVTILKLSFQTAKSLTPEAVACSHMLSLFWWLHQCNCNCAPTAAPATACWQSCKDQQQENFIAAAAAHSAAAGRLR